MRWRVVVKFNSNGENSFTIYTRTFALAELIRENLICDLSFYVDILSITIEPVDELKEGEINDK